MVSGRVVQVIGATLDAEFPEDDLPEIYNALEIKVGDIDLVSEVQQHLGGNRVRAVALGSTDGVVRNMEIVDTGSPIKVPVGEEVLGRVFNLLGKPVDIDVLQHLQDGLATHSGGETVVAVLADQLLIALLGEDLSRYQLGIDALEDDVALTVEHSLQLLERDVEDGADA